MFIELGKTEHSERESGRQRRSPVGFFQSPPLPKISTRKGEDREKDEEGGRRKEKEEADETERRRERRVLFPG